MEGLALDTGVNFLVRLRLAMHVGPEVLQVW